MNRTTTALVAFVLTVAFACSSRDAPGQTVSQRDSAGVTISENSGPEWTEATAWRLPSEPTLTIGVIDGPEEYLLFRAIGARRLSNGNIVIANGGTRELRFYDPTGTHLQSSGGEGDGPGEFRGLGEPWLLGSDSIAVWDRRNRRLSVFDIDGEFGRSFRLDPIPDIGRPHALGVLADNSLLVASSNLLEGQRPEGISRYPILYARHSLEGAHLATLARRPGVETNRAVTSGGGLRLSSAPYGRIPVATVQGNRWYYGSGDSWEIEVYSPDGALTHLFRRDEPNRPVTQEMVDEYRERDSGSRTDIPSTVSAARSRMRASVPIPETMPAYQRFLAGDDGSLWVQSYSRSGEQPSWAVFRDDGRYLGVVDTPMGARVTHIGDDFVLVIGQDELEVQQVQMYELIKP